MPTLHDMLHDSITTRTNALAHTQPSDLPDTTTRITRIRRTRTASAVAAFAVLLAGAASLPVTGAELFAPAAPTPGDIAYVEVPLSHQVDDPSTDPYGASCGQRIETVTESHGFTFDSNVTTAAVAGVPQVRVQEALVTYSGPTYTDAQVDRFVAIAKDGVVVAWAGFTSGSTVPSIDDDWVFDARFSADYAAGEYFGSYPSLCAPVLNGDPADSPVMWEAGEYQAYAVVTVTRTPELLAYLELAERGYFLGDPMAGSYQPGSVDCQEAVTWAQEDPNSPIPVQCEPFGVPGVTVDKRTGTATLPYTIPQGEGDLQVRLVSEPVTLTYEQTVYWSDIEQNYTVDIPTPLNTDELHIEVSNGGAGLVDAQTSAATVAELIDPDGFEVTFDLRAASSGTLELPETMEAWITTDRGQIVAKAPATIEPAGPIFQDRTTDYGSFKVVLGELEVAHEYMNGYLGDPNPELATGSIIMVGRYGAQIDGGDMQYEEAFQIYNGAVGVRYVNVP